MNVAVPTVLSLCAGIGGLDLGLRLALPTARAVCYVEREATGAGILAARFADGALDDAPIWSDVRTFDGRAWRGKVHLLTAGYPCQPFSIAGQRRGEDDPRHLWPHVARIIRECEPNGVFLENVGNHLRLGFEEVALELRDMGFRVEAGLFTAEEVGAPHRRERLFALAYSGGAGPSPEQDRGARLSARSEYPVSTSGDGLANAGDGFVSESRRGSQRRDGARPTGAHVAYSAGDNGRRGIGPTEEGARADGIGRRGSASGGGAMAYAGGAFPPGPGDFDAWRAVLAEWPQIEPALRGNSDGLSSRVDRLRSLGNGVVPLVAAHAYRTLRGRFDCLQ